MKLERLQQAGKAANELQPLVKVSELLLKKHVVLSLHVNTDDGHGKTMDIRNEEFVGDVYRALQKLITSKVSEVKVIVADAGFVYEGTDPFLRSLVKSGAAVEVAPPKAGDNGS